MVTISETREKDLHNVQRLWADGDVMKYVGFPAGLQQTDEDMAQWYSRIQLSRPQTNHYSVFENGVYCGEAFYQIEEKRDNSAALDIKLFPSPAAAASPLRRSLLPWKRCSTTGRQRYGSIPIR